MAVPSRHRYAVNGSVVWVETGAGGDSLARGTAFCFCDWSLSTARHFAKERKQIISTVSIPSWILTKIYVQGTENLGIPMLSLYSEMWEYSKQKSRASASTTVVFCETKEVGVNNCHYQEITSGNRNHKCRDQFKPAKLLRKPFI